MIHDKWSFKGAYISRGSTSDSCNCGAAIDVHGDVAQRGGGDIALLNGTVSLKNVVAKDYYMANGDSYGIYVNCKDDDSSLMLDNTTITPESASDVQANIGLWIEETHQEIKLKGNTVISDQTFADANVIGSEYTSYLDISGLTDGASIIVNDNAGICISTGLSYDPEARIGNKYYATLSEALTDVENNATIVLLKDVELSGGNINYYKPNTNITIDLNDHGIIGTHYNHPDDSSGNQAVVSVTGGNLTIVDNSTNKTIKRFSCYIRR